MHVYHTVPLLWLFGLGSQNLAIILFYGVQSRMLAFLQGGFCHRLVNCRENPRKTLMSMVIVVHRTADFEQEKVAACSRLHGQPHDFVLHFMGVRTHVRNVMWQSAKVQQKYMCVSFVIFSLLVQLLSSV